MRLRRLDLTRYGKFTDRTLDFGERIDGAPDLHIVYGPNEAGKSTAFSAFLDLLFGIEMQSRYGFLHPYATMRIGGCLELSCGTRELVRIKRPQPTLRNAADEPVAEAVILGDLSGLDRTAYRTMFSLDDDTLEAGGNSILASRGELGQLLFSASAGLSDLSRMLLDLRAEADGFARPNGRSGELADGKAELLRLRQERDGIDTLAPEFNRWAAEAQEAERQYRAALEERATAQAALAGVRRRLAAQPHMAAHARLRERIAALPDLPAPPPGWLDELPGLQREETAHRTATELARADIERLTQALAAIVVDEAALHLRGQLDRLDKLRVRHVAAELDLPTRRRESAGAEGEVRAILARLDRAQESEPARLLLTAAQTAVLNSLLARRSGVQAALDAAGDELARARFELNEAREALDQHGVSPSAAPLTQLASALAALRDSDHALRQRGAARAIDQQRERLAAALRALAPWQGSAEDLAAANPPEPARVQAWCDAAQKADLLVAQRRQDVERQESELLLHVAGRDAIGRTAGLLSDQQAAEIRAAREAAWAAHRRALDAGSADAFEAALRRDDVVASTRQGHERDLARLHQTAQEVEVRQAGAARARALLHEAESECQLQRDALARAAAAMGLDASDIPSPAWLLAWMGRREAALQSVDLLRQAERDARDAEADAAALAGRLRAALGQAALAVPKDAGLAAMEEAAQTRIDQEARADSLRQAVAQCERALRQRDLGVQRATIEDKKWRAEWREACIGCWLGEEAASLPIETVRETLAAAAELGGALKTHAGLAGRIQDMLNDQAAFAQEAGGLAARLGIDATGRSHADLAQAVLERCQDAARAAEDRQGIQEALAAAHDRLRMAEGAGLQHARRVGEMMGMMQAASLIELAGKLGEAAQNADLQRQAGQAERDLLAALQVQTLDEARTALADLPQSELEREEAALAAQIETLEPRTHKLFADSKAAADRIAAIGGDDAAARLEERRRTKLLVLEEQARHYLRLRLGIAAAERALRAYRDQHRSAMMTQASDAFCTISRGAYRGLGTQPDRDGGGDILVALGADGGSKLAVDLSKGTRFQLYLALRAAGYQEFARLRPPVPFIADDIMETFDDFRAEETLRVLGKMARLGQVIYLTHHDHLRAIAERTVPGVRVHTL